MILSVKVLAAVVKWTSNLKAPNHLPMHHVVIRDGWMTACDGHRMVRIPLEGVVPHDVIGLHRDDVDTVVKTADALGVASVDVRAPTGVSVPISVGSRTCMNARLGAVGEYPSEVKLLNLYPRRAKSSPPPVLLNPRFLSDMAEVEDALVHNKVMADEDAGSTPGVTLMGWGSELDGVSFRGGSGALYLVMPMRPALSGPRAVA